YLVGEVVPMLPQKLSNGICSLVEDEDRLVKSVLFRFGKDGSLRGSKLVESVIRSDKRLTYEQAKLFMTEKDLAAIRSAKPPQSRYSGNPGVPLSKLPKGVLGQIRDTIKTLWSIASKLRVSRLRAGSLDLASTEVKILVDGRGVPERIIQIENDDSHSLIEEFMLLANETVAKELRKRKLPGIHRVHPDPDPENLEELRAFVSLYDLSCGDLTNRKEVTKLLASIHKHPLAQVLRIKFLRSLKQACYRATPDGHYGLAKQDYLHFTSPIRRYADLVVHRIVEGILSSEQRKRPDAKRLDGIAKHISVTERNSVDAERESVKTKLVAFYERELKENKPTPHDAVITDIMKKGFFIELPDTLARGFVPMRTLPRDQNYRIATNGTSIVGRDPRKRLKLGQKIKVLVYKVDHAEKQIDFKLAGK
ncbi:MAG: RNB domain-containing ribonuclease, partial [Opitutae bacterium]|nr:RNB domain-containing ribonuclease [Opitutae bacterium]